MFSFKFVLFISQKDSKITTTISILRNLRPWKENRWGNFNFLSCRFRTQDNSIFTRILLFDILLNLDSAKRIELTFPRTSYTWRNISVGNWRRFLFSVFKENCLKQQGALSLTTSSRHHFQLRLLTFWKQLIIVR